jgi:Polysaccharide pyruvyl transferase
MQCVRTALEDAGVPCEVAWSPVFRPGALTLEDADPERYTHVVFACGPVHGEQLRWLHYRFAGCRRIAVGVTVIDPSDPATSGFDAVLARDGEGAVARDLSSTVATSRMPVVGVAFAPGQPEYGPRRRHDLVHDQLGEWLAGQDCARVPLDTRLDPRQWRSCATPDQFDSIVRRLDAVVTTRLHGLVLALRRGVPALAVDPVDGGGEVSAQARAWEWPALVAAEPVLAGTAELRHWWRWCLSPQGRVLAAIRAFSAPHRANELVAELLSASRPPVLPSEH